MLTLNATTATIWTDSWGDGGCRILYFVVEYRPGRYGTWNMVSNHVKPTERTFTVTELWPSTDYQLKITAFNNAGSTVAIYNFTTLTVNGSKCFQLFYGVHTEARSSAMCAMKDDLLITKKQDSLVVPELAPPVSHSGDQPFYANARVLIPIGLSLLILCCLIVAVLLVRRRSELIIY